MQGNTLSSPAKVDYQVDEPTLAHLIVRGCDKRIVQRLQSQMTSAIG
jgi:hypothetical protein